MPGILSCFFKSLNGRVVKQEAFGGLSGGYSMSACPSSLARAHRGFRPFHAQRHIGGKKIRICVQASKTQVVLTREKGKNSGLARLLDEKSIQWLEFPLVETAPGPDRDALPGAVAEHNFEWIIITSLEAATVFLEGWRTAGKPKVKIAVVGKGTSKVLEAEKEPFLLEIAFTPTKANAVHLSAELPLSTKDGCRVLYPASAKAGPDLQEGLEARGCKVTRLNTYNTVPVREIEHKHLKAAREADVIAIASPSAIEAWAQLNSGGESQHAIACIGSTSAKAAEKLGFKRLFFTDTPGLPGFLEAVEKALNMYSRV